MPVNSNGGGGSEQDEIARLSARVASLENAIAHIELRLGTTRTAAPASMAAAPAQRGPAAGASAARPPAPPPVLTAPGAPADLFPISMPPLVSPPDRGGFEGMAGR